MMKFAKILFISSLLLPNGALGENTIQQICGGLQGIQSCDSSFEFPTGVRVDTTRTKSFKPNPCKSKINYSSPCPTIRNPFRQCPGWTCVPGTDEIWIDLPRGITILTKRINVCEQVRNVLGSIGTQFITKAGAMCRCFPEALNLIAQGLYQSVKNGADLSEAAFTVISTSNKLQQCMLDNGFDVKDNKAEVEDRDLSPGQGWVVLRAAEIDMVTYADLAVAIAPCFTPAQCNPELIRGFFMNYLRKSKELMNNQLTGFLKEWLDIIGNMERKGQEVIGAAENFAGKITQIPDKIKAIRNEICVGEACLEQQAASFMQKISSLNELVHAIEGSKAASIAAIKVIPEMITQTRTAIEAAEADPDVNFLIGLIKSGKLTKVDDIWNSFQAVQKLPEIAGHLQKSVTSIQKFATQYNSYGHNTMAVIGEVLSVQWDTTAVGSGMTKIQHIIKTELETPLGNLTDAIGQLGIVLDSFPVKDGKFALQTGVASYQRYSTISMDVPCTRQRQKTFSAAGFRKTYSYPEFYLCPYGPKTIPWPNHHIPFIKVRTQ